MFPFAVRHDPFQIPLARQPKEIDAAMLYVIGVQQNQRLSRDDAAQDPLSLQQRPGPQVFTVEREHNSKMNSCRSKASRMSLGSGRNEVRERHCVFSKAATLQPGVWRLMSRIKISLYEGVSTHAYENVDRRIFCLGGLRGRDHGDGRFGRHRALQDRGDADGDDRGSSGGGRIFRHCAGQRGTIPDQRGGSEWRAAG